MSADRISHADLESQLERLRSAAVAAGIVTASRAERWILSNYPSRYYGNSCRLVQVGADTRDKPTDPFYSKRWPYGSGHCPTGLPEFLGWTNREAYDTMQTITATLYAVVRKRNERKRSH